MTYTSGGDGPYSDGPDYPTQQFRAIRTDQPVEPEQRQYQPRYEQPYREPYREARRDDYPAERSPAPVGRRRIPWVWLIPIVVVLVAAAGVGGYYAGHTQGKKDARTNQPKHYLSHTAVEAYIAKQYNVSNAQCYGGQDVPLFPNGGFTCTAAGMSFVVVIKNADTGSYQVIKTP